MRRLIAYSSLFAMLANLNVMTITFFVTAIPSVAYAEQSETPLLDRLRERYRLDDPSRNHHTEEAITSEFQRPTSHAPTETMQRMLDLDIQRDIRGLPAGDEEIDQQRYWRMAAGAGRTHTGPRLNEDGSLQATHADRATREYYRDANGELKFRVIENTGEIQYRNNGLSQAEMFSQEIENEGVRFGADQVYGDEEGYYEEGRISHAQLTDTNVRTGESFAYRAVTNNPNRALNTSVNENILQPGFSYLSESNRQGGGFFGACNDVETTNRRTIQTGQKRYEYCYENTVGNSFFCEIERVVEAEEEVIYHPLYCEPEEQRACGSNLGLGDSCWLCYSEYNQDQHGGSFYTTAIPSLPDCPGDIESPYGCYREERSTLSQEIRSYPEGCYERALPVQQECSYSCPAGYEVVHENPITGAPYSTPRCYQCLQYLYDGNTIVGCAEPNLTTPEVNCTGGATAPEDTDPTVPTDFELSCVFDSYTPLEIGTRGYSRSILDRLGPLFDGDEGDITWRANLDGYRCNPLGQGSLCPLGPESDPEDCLTYESLRDNPSTCSALQDDSACSEVDRVCADGMYDEVHDICWMESVRYQCEDGIEFVREETVITNSCESMLPCVGGDCYQVEPETSDKFEQAVGMASFLEDAGAEGCINDDGNAECTIFDGEVRECRYDLTGLIPNCCKDQSGTSIIQYVAFAKQSMRVEQMAYKGEFGTVVQGAWAPIRDGVSSAWQSLPFTSTSESIEGAAEAALSDNSWIANKMMEVIYNYMPESWAQVFVTNTASQGGDVALEWSEGFGEFAEVFGNVFGTIMAYYQAYQLLKLALNVLYACPSSQLDMGALIAGGQCFEYRSRTSRARLVPPTIWYTEHYCCYSSTLARIVMEQVHEIENIPLNQCAGLTPDLLETLDWDRIDFSEWVDLMFAADLMMEESMDGLTGSGRTLNNLNEDEDALPECPSGWEQDSPTSCVRYAGNANTSCPSSLEWDDWDADFGQFTCSIPYQRETDSSCVYSSRQIVIGYHEGEDDELIPEYRMCSADPQPKSNYGCPEGFSREDGICTARMQLAPSQRMNAVERTQERFDFDLDVTRRENIRQTREPIDCSQVPRPPICNYGFDPSN